MTTAQLRKLISQHEVMIAKLRERTGVLEKQLVTLRGMLSSTGTLLHGREHSATVNGMEMSDSHAKAISRAKRKAGSLMEAAYEAGIRSQNQLAERLGSSSATLSRYLDGRRVPKEFDEKVRALLPKWSGRWPGGVS